MTRSLATEFGVLDLFAGCGGLSFGFGNAGFEVVAGVDNDVNSLRTFQSNHVAAKALNLDLLTSLHGEITRLKGKIAVVVGGPPCQGFSISGKRDPLDPRNILYQSYVEVVQSLNPMAFVMENVPNMKSIDGGILLNSAIRDFESLGYSVSSKILLASDFGVPQNRKRLFVVGVRSGLDFSFPEPTVKGPSNRVTTSEAISDLPEFGVSDGTNYAIPPKSQYQKTMRDKSDAIWNHVTTKHSDKTTSIISMVPDGGNYKDLPAEFRETRKVNIAWTRYSGVRPSLTIDTGHRHHFHYKYNRIPTVRESARLQSFPDHFIFQGSKTSQYRQVGNAVPPMLAEAVALQVLRALIVEVVK